MKIPKGFLKRIVSARIPNPRLSKRFGKILDSNREVATQAEYYRNNEDTLEYIKEYLNYKAKYENICTRVWKAITGKRLASANEFVAFLKGCSNEFYNVKDEEERKKAKMRDKRISKKNRGW